MQKDVSCSKIASSPCSLLLSKKREQATFTARSYLSFDDFQLLHKNIDPKQLT